MTDERLTILFASLLSEIDASARDGNVKNILQLIALQSATKGTIKMIMKEYDKGLKELGVEI